MSTTQRSAYPENAPMAELRTAELFAVVGLRLWATGHRDPNDDGRRWQSGFAAAQIDDDGITAFNALLLIVATASHRSLDVRCPKCPSLGADEGWFLLLIGLLQRDCITGAELVLMGWLPPAAARAALPFAIVLADTMKKRDLRIPRRPDEDALNHRFDGVERGAAIRRYGQDTLALVH